MVGRGCVGVQCVVLTPQAAHMWPAASHAMVRLSKCSRQHADGGRAREDAAGTGMTQVHMSIVAARLLAGSPMRSHNRVACVNNKDMPEGQVVHAGGCQF